MEKTTRVLARYACQTKLDDLPDAVRRMGVRAFVNWVGCAAGGSREPDVTMMVEALSEFNGTKEATLVGRSERLDALNAALVNSMSSGALAFNDTHNPTVAHPTSPVAAALMALSERRPMTGAELLLALVLGIELQCRVGNVLCTPPAECAVGLSTQGLLGGIGAAIGAAAALGLDEDGMAAAIGHAANQAAGIRQAQSTMASHFIPGHAARCGLFAALLAARGFECSDAMIEGPKGFAVSFASRPQMAAATEGLGERFEILDLAFKPYPSGVVIHPVIDACLEVARRDGFDAAQIERIELTFNPLTAKLTDLMEPKGCGQALVSLQHWAAVTLMHRIAGIAQVADGVVRDPAVAAMRRKVSYTTRDGMVREAADLAVALKDGRRLEARVAHARGSSARPLTDEDVAIKTRDQLRTVFPEQASERILAQSWKIAECPDVGAFAKGLAG